MAPGCKKAMKVKVQVVERQDKKWLVMAYSQTCRGLPQVWAWAADWHLQWRVENWPVKCLVGSSPKGLQMSKRTGAEFRQASAWNASESSKKEIQRSEFSLLPLIGTSPEHRNNKRSLFVVWGTGKRASNESSIPSERWCTDWRGSTGRHMNLWTYKPHGIMGLG